MAGVGSRAAWLAAMATIKRIIVNCISFRS
jgi:hypothetical protein